MQTNYAAKPSKIWVEHVINEKHPDLALAKNFLLYFNLNDRLISKAGDNEVYVSDALVYFKKFIKPVS